MQKTDKQRNRGGGILQDRTWSAFQIDELFDIRATRSSIDKKNLVNLNGKIPYITRTDKSNGIDMYVGEQPECEIDEGNAITIGLDTQTVFYQATPFYTGQNIQVLRHPKLNRYIASFLLTPLKLLLDKFNWGGNGATLTRLKRSKILLPSDENLNPDWNFMETFMKDMESDILTSTLKYFKHLSSENAKTLMGGGNWLPFSLLSVFNFEKGNQNNMSAMSAGNLPLVSAKNYDNGYKNFVSPNSKSTFNGHIITLNLDGDGGAGIAYYQPAEMALDSHVGALIPKTPMSRYHLLFIAMCITKQREMFGHGYSINGSRIKGFKIMLPVDENNDIDYDYMDSYMRNLENIQIYNYLKHHFSKVI